MSDNPGNAIPSSDVPLVCRRADGADSDGADAGEDADDEDARRDHAARDERRVSLPELEQSREIHLPLAGALGA